MIEVAPGIALADRELRFRATRSGGPGGQNVNKVATRVELVFDVAGSPSLPDAVRAALLRRLASRLDGAGRLRIVAATSRSQAHNRELAVERLRALLAAALKPRRPRRATAPTRSSKARRLGAKRRRGGVKERRRRPEPE